MAASTSGGIVEASEGVGCHGHPRKEWQLATFFVIARELSDDVSGHACRAKVPLFMNVRLEHTGCCRTLPFMPSSASPTDL